MRVGDERRVLAGLTAAYVAGLVALLALPIGWSLNRVTVRIYVLGRDLGLTGHTFSPEFYGHVLNVLIFVPPGWLLGRLAPATWWRPLLVLVGLSVLAEVVQAGFLEREGQAADVVTNSLGAAVGVLIARLGRVSRG